MLKETTRSASQLTIVPFAFLLHNAEEAATIPAALPKAQAMLTKLVGHGFQLPSTCQYHAALLGLTLVAFALWLGAFWKDSLCYALVVLQATLALNVLNHVCGAILLGGYSPGLVTSVTAEAAASVFVISRLRQTAWLSRTQWLLLPVLAAILHGPLMFGGLWLLGRLR